MISFFTSGSSGLENVSRESLKLDQHRSDSMVLLQRSDTTLTSALGSDDELIGRDEHPDIVRQISNGKF